MQAVVHPMLYTITAIVALWWGGNAACRLLLNLTGAKDATAGLTTTDTVLKAGRVIGGLERCIIAIGLVCGVWEAVAAVIALKSIARFSEIDVKLSAEYFLVGSLFSMLWAILITSGWSVYDHAAGADLRAKLAAVVGKGESPVTGNGS